MTGLIGDYLRPTKQRAKFVGDPRLVNAAFATARSDVTVVDQGTTSSYSPSIFRPATECRLSNVAAFQPPGQSNWVPIEQKGKDGNVGAWPQQGLSQMERWEFDVLAADFEMVLVRNASLFRVWVNERPHSLLPVSAGVSDGVNHYYKITLPSRQRWRIAIEVEKIARFVGLAHKTTDDVLPPSITSRGRIIWVGDSIGEATFADLYTGTTQYQAGGFQHALGRLLGLHDFWQGYCAGGAGFARTSGSGTPPYGARLAYDVIPNRPDCVIFQISSNDGVTQQLSEAVEQEATEVIQALQVALPDCLILLCDPLAVPPLVDPVNLVNIAGAHAAAAACGVEVISTAGLFTGFGSIQTPTGVGNADMYAFPQPGGSDPGQTTPHTPQVGMDRIARFLAPKIAPALGIDLPDLWARADTAWTVT